MPPTKDISHAHFNNGICIHCKTAKVRPVPRDQRNHLSSCKTASDEVQKQFTIVKQNAENISCLDRKRPLTPLSLVGKYTHYKNIKHL